MLNRENPFKVYVGDFEVEAEAFLRKYQCEDAIENPQPIPIRDIATRLMSLAIIDSECLSLDGSVQGAITFTKGIVDVYDWTTEDYIGYPADGPSLFIDSDIINEGRINNTIAHECYHWWRHRNYFNYKRTHENSVEFGIRCDRRMPRRNVGSGQWTDVERMEWQARTIAPKILMPRHATKKKIDQLYIEIVPPGGYSGRKGVTEVVIERLSEFYKVSKQSAAIRMVELGYQEAQDYCTTDFNPEGAGKNRRRSNAVKHQQPITQHDAFKQYLENDFFRAIIDTGAFCFVDGYFVLKNDQYISYENGKPTLTFYAKSHLHECTIDFSSKLFGEAYLIHDASAHMMYRSDTIFKEEPSCDSNPQNTELYNKAIEFERKFARSKKTHKTASEMLKEYMADAHWNASSFQTHTQMDAINYTRVQQNYQKFTLRPLVTMGYCLGLDEIEMEEVLNAAGLTFNPTDEEQQAYKFLFSAFPERDLDVCNDFLEAKGFHKLGSQSRK